MNRTQQHIELNYMSSSESSKSLSSSTGAAVEFKQLSSLQFLKALEQGKLFFRQVHLLLSHDPLHVHFIPEFMLVLAENLSKQAVAFHL